MFTYTHFHKVSALVLTAAAVILAGNAFAEDSPLAGTWTITNATGSAVMSPVKIDATGNAQFTEKFTHAVEGKTYTFTATHFGQMKLNAQGQLLYVGMASGTAAENPKVRVREEVFAIGQVSYDTNAIAGVWMATYTYVKDSKSYNDEVGYPFLMVREGTQPANLVDMISGTWNLDVQGDYVDWSGDVEIKPDGSILGKYTNIDGFPKFPIVGFLPYAKDHQFQFEYVTTVEIARVGETTIALECVGTGNEDNTVITGTYKASVSLKTGGMTYTTEGNFTMTKIEAWVAPKWSGAPGIIVNH